MTEPIATLHVDESGPAEADSILFLHGGNAASVMWQLQRDGLPEFHQLAPDMPGFGESVGLGWTGLDDVVERLADAIRARGHGGVAHVVGISLGAAVGFMLTARHPDVVRSALLSGTPIRGLGPVMRATARGQLWLWKSVAAVASLGRRDHRPPPTITRLVEKGLGLDPSSATAVVNLVNAGLGKRRIAELTGNPVPILATAGSRESRVVTHALAEVARANHAVMRVAPGRHHLWLYEAPDLFIDTIRTWATEQHAAAGLDPVPPVVERRARRVRRGVGIAGERDERGSAR